ncbi:uncharacterized protein LOC125072111 [Vanessa atalanta]|uniref:uncharacterized protein LOC125072111 n=1 Tax=Vanessa atalanta TaxID=42275 RepID=UPI001FCDB106|nr:uncharacterized protein LOC125072111 [Vanessa atalanta]
MSFYYWGLPQTPMFVKFIVPTDKQKAYLKYILDGHVLEPIDWTSKTLLMIERDNSTYFLVERNDRGHYYLYEPQKGLKEGDIVERLDVRIKQTGDNLYFGIMLCKEDTVFIFARINQVPKKDQIQDAAGRLGYRGRGGRSYLYQGHQWMPIPEADDWHFEQAMKYNDAIPPINNNVV